ncbi:DUF3883 domain-containing protein [Actinomadura sp. 1N219]|uniref:DUF3883 domain-containing protein n=1 Tax=Actinomadura sp. 1N219 TaxID=3375152 RepID=UPI0037ACDA12
MSDNSEIILSSHHFTEVFVEHLITCMSVIPSHQAGGVEANSALTLLQARVGVARRPNQNLLTCLLRLNLVTDIEGMIGRSPRGDRLRRNLRNYGHHAVVPVIMQSGFMADQIRTLRATLRRDSDGYRCGRAVAQSAAPQLVGLLSRMPDVTVAGQLLIGPETGLELDSVWNELPPDSRSAWEHIEKRRKAIGDRAEQYSVQLERSAHVGAIGQITWVSRDDDSFGYDIEVSAATTRRIEVKGSAGRDIQFFLSANEYRVALRHGSSYEIHFWGEIDLRRDPRDDYERLRAAGYPIRVIDPTVVLATSPWTIEPAQYRVTRPRK